MDKKRRTESPSYGLVLAGGGAKGVYQIGAWRALRELGISIDCVVGTSVGAMNGALVALGLYDEAEALWKSMSIERGFQLSAPLRRPDKLFSIQNADILARELWSRHGLDMTPLRNRLEELVDEEALRDSPVEFGLVTYEITGRRGRELFKEDIPQGRLMDYIMASAAYPGLIRPQIDGKTYLDGGLVDNVPVRMLLKKRQGPAVVVDIGDGGLPSGLDPELPLVYVKPLESLGTAFEFQPETAQRKMDMGWLDTMKAFGRFSGTWMYFENAEYQRLLRRWGTDTVEGLEHYARVLGMVSCGYALRIPLFRSCWSVNAYRKKNSAFSIPVWIFPHWPRGWCAVPFGNITWRVIFFFNWPRPCWRKGKSAGG